MLTWLAARCVAITGWAWSQAQWCCSCTSLPSTSSCRTLLACVLALWRFQHTHPVRLPSFRCWRACSGWLMHVWRADPRKLKKNVVMFATIQHKCGAQVALTSRTYTRVKKMKGMLSRSKIGWPDIKWVVTDKSLTGKPHPDADTAVLDQAKWDDLAFLQYTSGSTAEPKVRPLLRWHVLPGSVRPCSLPVRCACVCVAQGVMVTHGNLAHNLTTITRSLYAKDDTVVVSWLPQYHDMGLIGSHLGATYVCDAVAIARGGSHIHWLLLVYVAATAVGAVSSCRPSAL